MWNIGMDDAAFRTFLNLAGVSVALYLMDVVLKFLSSLSVLKWATAKVGAWSRFVRPLILTALAWSLLASIGIDVSDWDVPARAGALVILFLLVYLVGESLWRIGLAVVLAGVAYLFLAAGVGLITMQATMALGCLLVAAAAPVLWFLGAVLVAAFADVPVLAPLARAFAAICYLLAGAAGLIALGAGVVALAGVLLLSGGVLLLVILPLVCLAILMGIFLEPFITRRESAPPAAH